MIAANVAVAKRLRKARMPILYRVHDSPSPERVEELVLVLRSLGFRLNSPRAVQTGDLSRVLRDAAGGPPWPNWSRQSSLRSMARADYRPQESRTLRPRPACLRAFHVTDPALSRPAGSPGHKAFAASRQSGGVVLEWLGNGATGGCTVRIRSSGRTKRYGKSRGGSSARFSRTASARSFRSLSPASLALACSCESPSCSSMVSYTSRRCLETTTESIPAAPR